MFHTWFQSRHIFPFIASSLFYNHKASLFPLERNISISLEVTCRLEYIQFEGVVHCDIKLESFLFDENTKVKRLLILALSAKRCYMIHQWKMSQMLLDDLWEVFWPRLTFNTTFYKSPSVLHKIEGCIIFLYWTMLKYNLLL